MKKRLLTIVLCVSMCLSLLPSLMLSINAEGSTEGGSGTEAYFTHEDRETLGMWYTGVDGTYENRDNRVYGKEGLILFYHGQVNDGNALAAKGHEFEENYETFKPMQDAHYIELPDYVEKIEKIQGTTSMWNNNQYTIENRIYNRFNYDENDTRLSAPLYINYNDEEFIRVGIEDGKGVYKGMRVGNTGWFFDNGVAEFKFTVTDNEWHTVSIKVGDNYDGQSHMEALVEIVDEQGNVVASKVATDVVVTPYLTFKIKGTFSVRVQGYNGYAPGGMQGIFFDAHTENENIGVSNITSELVGARTVKLNWTNTADTAYTNVYRRVKGTNCFEYLATVAPGVNTYIDESAAVATDYEYTVAPGVKQVFSEDREWDYYGYLMTGYEGFENTPDLIDFNAIDTSVLTNIQTAPYILTHLEILGSNLGCQIGGKLSITAKLYRDVKDAEGNVTGTEPFAGAMIKFTLGGEYATSFYEGTIYDNMNTNLGQAITNENGEATITIEPPYAGAYDVTASFAETPDANDPMKGYDASSATKEFVVTAPNTYNDPPMLFTVTDAVKPGMAFTITGNYIGSGGILNVAYAPSNGEVSREFSRGTKGLKYLKETDIYVVDNTHNAGVTAVFPKDAQAGVYDFWVQNEFGWSKAITMNIARPLFINQEQGYAGMPIEIAGRNFLGSEFGLSDNTKVKLVRIGDVYGQVDGVEASYVIDINTGIKYTAEECFTGEEVQISNQFRIEFTVPDNAVAGKYQMYVSNKGEDLFMPLQGTQEFVIYEKKAQSWDESVFGAIEGNDHIGNDPLDIKVAWVQNINYNNVITVDSKYISADGDYTAWGGDATLKEFNKYVNDQITALSSAGGGVLYFPNGYYFLTGMQLASNVIVTGESRENTVIYYQCTADTEHWNSILVRADSQKNIGVANMTFTIKEKTPTTNPSRVIMYSGCENMFASDLTVDFYIPEKYNVKGDNNRALGIYSGKNLVLQHIKWTGTDSAITASGTTLANIRDVDIHISGLSNSFAYMNCFLENTSYVSGNEGHGWTGRNNAYCAYNYIKDIGRKNGLCEGKGEVFYFEPAGATPACSRGYILEATARTFTVARIGGEVIDENWTPYYRQIAVTITSGRGVGQTRYFEQKPVAAKDGVVYGNTYKLCDWEKDWDVIPDHTSQYSTIEPMMGQTLVNNKAEDCSKTMMLYLWCYDSVVYGNKLYRTEGIQVMSNELDTGRRVNIFYRVENNYLEGISDGTGAGGIGIECQSRDQFEPSIGHLGGVVRGNTVKDLRNYTGLDGNSEFNEHNAGIFLNSYTKESSLPGLIINTIIENNTIINCEYGILIDARVDGVLLKNNILSEIGINGKDIPEDEVPPKQGRAETDVTIWGASNVVAINETLFMVDGVISNEFSGTYGFNEELPVLEKEGFAFLGWSKTETVTDASQIITLSDGTVCTLYPIFGYSVTFMNNYEEDGVDKGVYALEKGLDGSAFPRLPRLFRAGYTFDGWYLDAACTEEFTAPETLTENVVLYAKWVSKDSGEDTETDTETGVETGTDDDKSDNDKNNIVIILVVIGAVALVGGGTVAVVLIVKKKNKKSLES